MYCKYCGNKIDSDTTKCVSCGANINLNDGGQSFFDDNELSAWQSDKVSYNAQTDLPKTELRESPSYREPPSYTVAPQASVGTNASQYSAPSIKKNILSYFNISSSNKLIIFCIASALVIVLLVVAIIAVLNSGDDTTDINSEHQNKTENNDGSQKAGNENHGQSNDSPTSTETPEKEQKTENTQKQEDSKDKTEITNITIIDKNGNKVDHPVSAYIDENNILYVSLDIVLKYKGYNDGQEYNNAKPNNVKYDNKSNGSIIEIVRGSKDVWTSINGEDIKQHVLEGKIIYENGINYVPIKSFLVEIFEYDEDKIKSENENNNYTLYFSK